MFILLSIAGFVVMIAFFLVRFLMGKGAFNLMWLALVVGLAYFIYDEIQHGYMGTLLLFMWGIGFLSLLLLIFFIPGSAAIFDDNPVKLYKEGKAKMTPYEKEQFKHHNEMVNTFGKWILILFAVGSLFVLFIY